MTKEFLYRLLISSNINPQIFKILRISFRKKKKYIHDILFMKYNLLIIKEIKIQICNRYLGYIIKIILCALKLENITMMIIKHNVYDQV